MELGNKNISERKNMQNFWMNPPDRARQDKYLNPTQPERQFRCSYQAASTSD